MNKPDETINIYQSDLGVKGLQKLRRTLAKRANQRLVRLERANSNITGESYASYGAAQYAYEYLERTGRNKRFSEKQEFSSDRYTLQWEISKLQDFLTSKSSTVVGQRDIEKKRVSSFEKGEWGMQWKTQGVRAKSISFASNREFYDFLNSSAFNDLKKAGFDSDTVLQIMELAKDKMEFSKIVEKIESALEEFREKGNADLKTLTKHLGVNLK